MRIPLSLASTLLIFVVACADGATSEVVSLTDVEEPQVSNEGPSQISTDDYDLVVMDADRWYINLNVHTVRGYKVMYTGYLMYHNYSGDHVGQAWAYYDPQHDVFCVSAIDPGWDNRTINYFFAFPPTGMDGAYYYDKPVGISGNPIRAKIVYGSIGDHVASAPPSGTIQLLPALDRRGPGQ